MENAKVSILLDNKVAFYSYLLMNLNVSYDTTIPTACTNGIFIKVNPEFFRSLSPDERIFVLLHEVLHVAFLHPLRGGERHHKRWRYACDFAINLLLVNQGYVFIEGGLLDGKFKGLSAEAIYELLPDNPEGKHGKNILDGDVISNTGSVAEQDILDKVISAAQQAEMMDTADTIPSEVKRTINNLLFPKLAWDVLLMNYYTTKAKEDYSWAKRNKRYRDIYLPSMYSEKIDRVSVYVDASCSVSKAEFDQYLAEIYSVKIILDPKLLEVISFDTHIYDIHEIHEGEEFDVSLVGGGGTDLTDVAKRVNKTEADVVILFTDGHYQPVEYNKEVLHIIVNNSNYTNNQEHPVIHIDL